MEQKSMTALVSAFSRGYHSSNNKVKIFDDNIAKKLLSEKEYNEISNNMIKGISFFNPAFKGSDASALRWIVDNQLSPTPLARGIFSENSLEKAVEEKASQYVILASGYDTFAYRRPNWGRALEVFEVDLPITLEDKIKRLKEANIKSEENTHYIKADLANKDWIDSLLNANSFNKNKISFFSILGLSYYMKNKDFASLLSTISQICPKGSYIAFDYPVKEEYSKKQEKQEALAKGANEEMLGVYSSEEIIKIASENNFKVIENLTPKEITNKFFTKYNEANPKNQMKAFDNVNYCLLKK